MLELPEQFVLFDTEFTAWEGSRGRRLNNVSCSFLPNQFHNIRAFFKAHGIAEEHYNSSTIVRAFGVEPMRTGHDALNDARTILDGLRLLYKRLPSKSS